jgi:hypothetical protein
MPNITPEEIADAIAEILEDAEGQGVVVTDKKFSQSNKELFRLLKSQADEGNDEFRGWIFTFLSIPNQTNDSDCIIDTTYRFFAKFFHFYTDDYKENLTTDLSFKRAIFEASEALNASHDLGLGNLVRHQSLISEGEFDIEDLGGGSVNKLAHTAVFSLDVVVTNKY